MTKTSIVFRTRSRAGTRICAAVLMAGLTLGSGAGLASASSDSAWADFAKEVEASCLKAAAAQIDKPKAVVDPYGSESYGMALVSGPAKGAKVKAGTADITLICVFDKKTRRAEVGSELSPRQVTVKPKA
ncbi:hypothetical protein [Rhizobium sp. SAFR-030]|uniref:hypothetical protein n=1 Tax=Rhizobium sp. SAFR-030 TaxID=3387277 RepID=UPI003F7D6E9A